MDRSEIAKLKKKNLTVTKQLIGELYLVKNMSEIVVFTQTYILSSRHVASFLQFNKLCVLINSV